MFITFEGTDGSGKTTQVANTLELLRARGYDVLLTREPGGTPLGDQVRALLLDKDASGLSPRAELLLFNASRAQLVRDVIRPHLARGGVVLCDRYIDSTVAYQGYGHGLDLDYVIDTVRFATGDLLPDLTLFLDVPPEEGLRRRAAASLFGEEYNRLDAMAAAFHQRVYQGYRAIGDADNSGRWQAIDAAQPLDTVFAAITRVLDGHLPPRRRAM